MAAIKQPQKESVDIQPHQEDFDILIPKRD